MGGIGQGMLLECWVLWPMLLSPQCYLITLLVPSISTKQLYHMQPSLVSRQTSNLRERNIGTIHFIHFHGPAISITRRHSWLSAIFYFGWLAWGIPSNLLMQKSPSGKYLAINIFMWGVLLMWGSVLLDRSRISWYIHLRAQAASRNFTELAVLRILSGAFEAIADPACVFPTFISCKQWLIFDDRFMLITTMFYRRAEQPSRISMWYASNGIGVAGGGLLGYGIGNIKGSLPSWKYEYVHHR